MNSIKNKVQLIGNLGQDPELKELDDNKKVVNFSIATNETFKNTQGDKETKTQWHNVVAWNKTAEIISKYASKGSQLAIEGKLISRSYDDKEGNKKYITEVLCHEVLLLDKKAAE